MRHLPCVPFLLLAMTVLPALRGRAASIPLLPAKASESGKLFDKLGPEVIEKFRNAGKTLAPNSVAGQQALAERQLEVWVRRATEAGLRPG